MRVALGIVLCMILVMTASTVFAVESPCFVPTDVQLSSVVDELDTEWPDSIFYWDPNAGTVYWNGTNYWMGHKFTAPANFTLQAIRILITNNNDIVSDAEVWIMQDDNENGGPGTDYYDHASWTADTFVDDWNECSFAEDDYIDLEAGENFWIVVGCSPGGDQANPGTGWWPLVANPGNTENTWISDTDDRHGDWQFRGPVHMVVNALGEIEAYSDPEVLYVNNDIDKFFFHAGESVVCSAMLANNGTEASSDFDVNFVITDSEGNEVVNDVTGVTSIAAGETATASSGTWTPDATGRYIVTATIQNATGDASEDNNVGSLLQTVVDDQEASWYYYDDGSFEFGVNYGGPNGVGAGFKPATYPGQIDSASWWFHENEIDDVVTLALFFVDEESGESSLLWSDEHTVTEEGWVTRGIVSNEGNAISVQDGYLVVAFQGDPAGTVYYRDTDDPNSAANDGMHNVGFGVAGTPYPTSAGNWAMRAKMGPGVAPTIVFPTTQVDFGTVCQDSTVEIDFMVNNDGDGPGLIDSMLIGQTEIQYVGDWPLVLPPNSQTAMTFTFSPTGSTPLGAFQGAFRLWHNDFQSTQNPVTVICSAEVQSNSVGEYNGIPTEYFLSQNYPNPFNPTTAIEFGLRQSGLTKLSVYNINGQLVSTLVNGTLEAGYHNVTFDASNLSSGIYYYSIQSGNFSELRKMVLIK